MKADGQYLYVEQFQLRIAISTIWDAILNLGIPKQRVESIRIFGSCLHVKSIEKKFLFFKWQEIAQPNDLDVAVFLTSSTPAESRTTAEVGHYGSDGYACWWEKKQRHNFLHIFTTTKEEWKQALAQGHSDAKALLGSFVLYQYVGVPKLAPQVEQDERLVEL